MTGREIVALLTEVVAKGGNLLLNVGPAADGTIPELQAAPLRDAGRWIAAHDDVISDSRPWTVWGDELTRYTMTGERLNAIDLSGAGTFAALGRAAGRVRSVEAFDGAPTLWEQLDDRLQIRRLDRSPIDGAAVYHVELDAPPDAPIELFSTPIDGPIELAPLLADVAPGSIVQLGDGTYLGPVRVPVGVTLRGLGHDRTVIDGRESTAVTLARGARLEHVTVRGGGQRIAWFPKRTVSIAEPHTLVLGCHIDGHIVVGADDSRIRACHASGVTATGVERLVVSRSRLRGDAMGRRRRDRRWRRTRRRELRAAPSPVRDPDQRRGRCDGAREHDRGPLVGCPSRTDRGQQRGRQRVRPHDARRRRRRRGARPSDRATRYVTATAAASPSTARRASTSAGTAGSAAGSGCSGGT